MTPESILLYTEGGEGIGSVVGIAQRWNAAYPRDTGRKPIVVKALRHLLIFQGWMNNHHWDLIAGMIVVFIPGNHNGQPV